jgi:hypothetical protein
MDLSPLAPSLSTLFGELVDGASGPAGYVLNQGDAGALRSLDALSAADASQSTPGGATIAAHLDHVRYGFSLLNRWAAGENPWDDADWAASWKITTVSDAEWVGLRAALRDELVRWRAAIRQPRELDVVELNGVLASLVHFAYHLGAIRQIHRAARGPKA